MTKQEAITHFTRKLEYARDWGDHWVDHISVEALELALGALKQEREKGEWIKYQQRKWIYAKCGLCGEISNTPTPYCAYCGAEMEVEVDNDGA